MSDTLGPLDLDSLVRSFERGSNSFRALMFLVNSPICLNLRYRLRERLKLDQLPISVKWVKIMRLSCLAAASGLSCAAVMGSPTISFKTIRCG